MNRRLGRIVPERLANVRDGARERILGHVNFGPERFEQRVLADDLTGTLRQERQDVDQVRGQRHIVALAHQDMAPCVDCEWREAKQRITPHKRGS